MQSKLFTLLLVVLLPLQSFGAINATAVWEARTTGAVTNGASFDSAISGAGTDYSQQDASQLSLTDLATSGIGVTTVTSATGGFTSLMVGNALHLNSGTNATAGFYFITVFTNSNTVTVDRAPDNGGGGVSAGNGKVGGAHSDPALVCAAMVAGNIQWIRSGGTFSITSASFNVAGGCLQPPAGTAIAATQILGYGSTRGDNGTKPVLQASGIATFKMLQTLTSANAFISNLAFDGASLVSSAGIDAYTNGSSGTLIYRCKFSNFTNWASKTGSSSVHCLCEATGCGTNVAFASGVYYFCTSHGNTVNGFHFSDPGDYAYGCISYGNTGASTRGFVSNAAICSWINCTSYGNGSHGYYIQTTIAGQTTALNCISYGNTGNGFDAVSSEGGMWSINCRSGGNSADFGSNVPTANRISFTALTVNPFINAAGNDFRLNTTVGGGVSCRSASYPDNSTTFQFPGASTLNYLDIGAVQSQANAGGSTHNIGGGKGGLVR